MWIMDGNVHPDAVKHNMYIFFLKRVAFFIVWYVADADHKIEAMDI